MKSKILIVDDNKENIDALVSILEQDYTVQVAVSGPVALRMLEKISPDLILLDKIMPEMDGFEVLTIIRQNSEFDNTPVIFLTGESSKESVVQGLKLGAVDYITKPYNPDIISLKVKNHLELKMYRDGLEFLVEERTTALASSREAIMIGMSLLAEGRDQGTGEHIQRIKLFAKVLANRYFDKYPDRLTQIQVEQIVFASTLHDIGKVSVGDAILLKNGPLTKEEFDEMKKHTVYGGDVLRKTNSILKDKTGDVAAGIDICEGHHERYDGTGYPNGIKGEKIPISARIVAVADVYDALTSDRPYKKAFTHDEATNIICVGDGRTMPEHFDAEIIEIFKQSSQDFQRILAQKVTI